MKLRSILTLVVALCGCASVQDHPYYLTATGLKCDGVIVAGSNPILDPVMAYQVCEDIEGHFYFPNGLVPNASVSSAAGLVSAAVGQAAAVGAMMGGF
jgi:hypothetical protein